MKSHGHCAKTEIEKVREELASAIEEENSSQLRRIWREARKLIAGDSRLDELVRVQLLQISALAACELYELEGNARALTDGIEQLKLAKAILTRFDARQELVSVNKRLAIATVRAGEQGSDVVLFRQAIVLIDSLDSRQRVTGELINARAVATFTIGALTADIALVLDAVETLRTLLRQERVSSSDRTATSINLCSGLIANARLSGSLRVYKELIQTLEGNFEVPIADKTSALYARYKAQAMLEMASLTGAIDPVLEVVPLLEELVGYYEEKPFHHLTALHSLAQAHFRLGKSGSSAAHFNSAIAYVERALRLLSPDLDEFDARRSRLTADLGAYRQALAIITSNDSQLDLAEDHYRQALNALSADKSPALFARIAQGLFGLLWRKREWQAASSIFREVEYAWTLILSDPNLSSTVGEQAPRTLAGEYPRAAWCFVQLNELEQAALVLDRGRALQITLSLDSLVPDKDTLSENQRDKLRSLEREVSRARFEESEEVCRTLWRNYLDCRRNLGLLSPYIQATEHNFLPLASFGGIFVQILLVSEGIVALLHFGGEEIIALPLALERLRPVIGLITYDRRSRLTVWHQAYQNFLARPDDQFLPSPVEGEPESRLNFLEAWNNTIETALDCLGAGIMSPVHKALLSHGFKHGDSVVLSPPGELAQLPIPSAKMEDGSSFSDHWQISTVPNFSVFKRLVTDRFVVTYPMNILTVASPSESASPSLPYSRIEVSKIREHACEADSSHLTEENATLENVLDAAEHFSILHFACHSQYLWDSPLQSGIELANHQRLTLGTLMAGNDYLRHARLVVLSSCESGISSASSAPDEFVGLPSAFLKAGAQAVICSLWSVYDDAAMLFFDRFYRFFLDKKGRQILPPSIAISKAQHWLRNVSMATLYAEGFYGMNETSRLRRFGSTGSAPPCIRRQLDANTNRLPKNADNIKPFSAPIDWAGFVLFGN